MTRYQTFESVSTNKCNFRCSFKRRERQQKKKKTDRIGNTSFRRIVLFWGSLRQLFRRSCRIRLSRLHCSCRREKNQINQSTLPIQLTKRRTKSKKGKKKKERWDSFVEIWDWEESSKVTCPHRIRISSFRRRRRRQLALWIWARLSLDVLVSSFAASSASSSLSPSGLWSEWRWLWCPSSIYPLGRLF